MKTQKFLVVTGLVVTLALIGVACAPAPTPVPPTAAPTQPPPSPVVVEKTVVVTGTPPPATPTVVGLAAAGVNQPIKTPPLKVADRAAMTGKSYTFAIVGIGGWLPSRLGVDMSPIFAKYAKEKYGYDVTFSFQESPFSALFQKAAASLATRSQEYNIMIIDSQWQGALAEPGWIISVDDVIKLEPDLDVQWYHPVLQTTYQVYPDGTGQRWGFPEESDTVVLYVRKDLFSDPKEMADFKAKYGRDLPQTFEDWEKEDFASFEQIAEFFTRPDKQLWGTQLEYTKEYDFMSMYIYPFMFSMGGDIWDANSRNVYGILNSDINASAMIWNKKYLQWQPPGSINWGISETTDTFVTGKVATEFQWAAVGGAMITPENKDKVIVVPPPGYKRPDGTVFRLYCVGGQPWAINAFNDPEHMRIAIDFMKWWYLPETQLEYAKRGGNPSDKKTLESPGFDDIQPWFRAHKYMIARSRDFWHDPKYSEILAIQQEGWTAFASGQVSDPKNTLEWIACQQQKTLFEAGRTVTPPPASCAKVTLTK